MKLKGIENLNVKGKRVLVRVDFNVPIKEGEITDTTRIEAALPTIKYLIENGAKVILMSHLGRPNGKMVPELSLRPVADELSRILAKEVKFVPDCIGDKTEKMVSTMKDGDILLLENVRFHIEEKKNDDEFAKKLASLGEIYINDAFGTAHRAQASTYGVAQFIRERAAGFLMIKELEVLGKLLKHPPRPFVLVLGGAKISTKVPLIMNFLDRADRIMLGGGMVFTFFKSQGLGIGDSICEDELVEKAKEILSIASQKEVDFLLPVDLLAAKEISEETETIEVPREDIPEGWKGVDIGKTTISIFNAAIEGAKTIFWNGPMGIFEVEKFSTGSREIGKKIDEETMKGAFSVVGGGDTVSCVRKFGINVSHISTGGGASLEFLSGESLPALKFLMEEQ